MQPAQPPINCMRSGTVRRTVRLKASHGDLQTQNELRHKACNTRVVSEHATLLIKPALHVAAPGKIAMGGRVCVCMCVRACALEAACTLPDSCAHFFCYLLLLLSAVGAGACTKCSADVTIR
eukprot:853526-Pelagomonas_calceolata.AAC.2